MRRYHYRRITEKTLEINICNNIIEAIRKNSAYRRAYWIGISMRLERHIGLDVGLAPGTSRASLVLGLQFKKPIEKRYDLRNGEHYYLFSINNNSANDQHIILWMLSNIVHRVTNNRYVFIGYVFPKYIDHRELSRYSPNFLGRTLFVDAMVFPLGVLDRLPHDVVVYERSNRVIVRSKEYELRAEDILDGEKLIQKLVSLEREDLVDLESLKHRSRMMLEKIILGLHQKAKEGEIRGDVIKYIDMKIARGWQIKISSLLV